MFQTCSGVQDNLNLSKLIKIKQVSSLSRKIDLYYKDLKQKNYSELWSQDTNFQFFHNKLKKNIKIKIKCKEIYLNS